MDNFREWVSDNLRYIMLICAIAVVVCGVFFGVRALTGRQSSGNTAAETAAESTAAEAIKAEEIESGVAMTESVGALEEGKIPEITGLVRTYYMALNSKNVESVRGVSDNLTDEDVRDIEISETEYSDIKAYIKPGPENDDSSYVVYASYDYINPSLYVKHPGLSWLYVKRNDAGEYKIVVDASADEKLTAYVNEISAGSDVKALVDEITKASEQADLDEQAAAEAAGTAEAQTEEAAGASAEDKGDEAAQETVSEDAEAASEEAAPAEEASSEETAPAEESSGEDDGEEDSDDGLGYNNTFPEDGASEHAASIGSTCNLRAGAGYNYKVITVLDQGTPVTVLGELSKGWYHVSCDAGDGYVGSRFIDFG